MPGVAEEVLCSTETTGQTGPECVRVVLIGEYGGIVREMVRFILGLTDDIPDPLLLRKQQTRSPCVAHLLETERSWVEGRYEAIAHCLRSLRDVAAAGDETWLPRLGMTVGDWKSLMTTQSPGHMRRLLSAG